MKSFYLSFLFFVSFVTVKAQTDIARHACAETKIRRVEERLQAKPTVEDPRENNYDVKYVHLDIAVNNLNTNVKGVATTKAVVTATSMSEYVFELIGEFTIDSLKFNGVTLASTLSGSVRSVALPSALSVNTLFTVQVYYHGEPSFGPGFFTTGIRTEVSPTWGASVTYTLSEPYAASDWWPVKQSLMDKIDSSDVWLTIPAGLKAGSNGVLKAVTPVAGGKFRYEWQNRNPIDYYLISFAVSTYVDYSYYMHFDNSTDSMLIQNYVYDNPATLPYFKEEIDSTALMINYFSGLFGRYPFWEEKYGHCMSPLGGGMEHQTMTTLGNFETSLVAHELGHQWFGDHVTCGTWQDIWLNEGFASYLDYLFINRFHGSVASRSRMNTVHNNIMGENDGSVYCTDTTDVGRIFSGRLSYDKGAAVIHTLRFIINNDNLFFGMLKNYQQQFANGNATTEEFKTFATTQANQNLDAFFDQWIYGEGFPTYAVQWNQVGDQVVFIVNQTTAAPSSVSFFNTPLAIQFTSPQGDTIVRIANNTSPQTHSFTWNKPMNGMVIDPDNWIINKTGTVGRDHSLTINGYDTTLFLIYPNPTSNDWSLDGMPTDCTLRLTDIAGRVLWTGENKSSNRIQIKATDYAPGLYLLHIYKEGSVDDTIKLQKMK